MDFISSKQMWNCNHSPRGQKVQCVKKWGRLFCTFKLGILNIQLFTLAISLHIWLILHFQLQSTRCKKASNKRKENIITVESIEMQ